MNTEISALKGSSPEDEAAGAALGPTNAENNGPGVGVDAPEPISVEHNTAGQSSSTDANCTCGAAGSVSGPVVAAIQNAAPATATPATNAVRVTVELRAWVDIAISSISAPYGLSAYDTDRDLAQSAP
jgi:hypothetical protein